MKINMFNREMYIQPHSVINQGLEWCPAITDHEWFCCRIL